tara:strand:- start:8 stop:439 length:432 start_codon:yes stop_codon:yes gene_type:complete
MKKESSFKLKSGNDLGRSATKLMKQSPARAEDKGIHEGVIKNPSKKPKLIQNIEKAITSEQGKLEGKIRGFFGSLQKGFKTAKKKRDIASSKRTEQIKKQKAKLTEKKQKLQSTTQKIGDKIVGDFKEAFVGEGKLFRPHKKK